MNIMSGPIKVVVVDDEPRLLAAWGRIVRMQPDMELVAAYSNAGELRTNYRTLKADVILLDLSMPGDDPVEVLREMKATGVGCRVVVFSGHNDHAVEQMVLEAGAWGLIDKLQEPDFVLAGIRRAAQQ